MKNDFPLEFRLKQCRNRIIGHSIGLIFGIIFGLSESTLFWEVLVTAIFCSAYLGFAVRIFQYIRFKLGHKVHFADGTYAVQPRNILAFVIALFAPTIVLTTIASTFPPDWLLYIIVILLLILCGFLLYRDIRQLNAGSQSEP